MVGVSFPTVRVEIRSGCCSEGKQLRITSRFGAVFASTALAGSMMVGGAGIANAQGSADLLGSLMPEAPDVGLTVATGEDAVGGGLTNNTDAALNCEVGAADAELVQQVETLVDGEMSLEDALAEAEFADGNSDTTEFDVVAEGASDWSVDGVTVGEEFTAGAYADCGDEVDPVFAYDSAGPLGSLDIGGSLGDTGGSLES